MPVYARGESWVVSVGSGKDRYRATFDNKKDAEEDELKERLRRKTAPKAAKQGSGASSTARVSKTLQDAYDRTYALHWKGEKGERTSIINGNAVLNVLGRSTLVSEVTPDEIMELIETLEDQGNSGSTVNKKLSCLSMMLKTAKEQWPTCLQFVPPIPRRKEGSHRIRWMDTREEEKALAMCEHLGLDDLRDYIIVGIDTGFRRSEQMHFATKDYFNGMLHLYAPETKGNKNRAIPATKRVHKIIQRRSNSARLFAGLTESTLRSQWEALKGHMGMDDDKQFVVHMLRHTCASRMVQRGVPLAVVKEWMGHADISTTMRYAHLAPSSLLQGKEALEVEPKVKPQPPHAPVEVELQDF